ncbi:hypothetical protein AJ79_08339 [Helicocarpus griseus UAMH5409]|uniref:Cytochrome P450 n=1 Tax=Helicocarpus griseus UAMH5409 TaxID=1447875 RepID=A0A2B7WU40_9EURO|nr:hypothetical protein AJ79_08339 [Helicocarpus griseus UAMH5409]
MSTIPSFQLEDTSVARFSQLSRVSLKVWLCMAVATVWTVVLYSRQRRPRRIRGIPIVGLDGGKRSIEQARKHFISNSEEMMREGYEKTQGGYFYIPSPSGERLMIPTRNLEELKNMPDDHVDFTGSFMEMFAGRYTTIGQKWHLHPGVIKKSLNSSLTEIMPPVQEEIYDAFNDVLPPCEGADWTSLTMADRFTEIIARASSRMMGGKALSRNKDWVATSINFTTDTWIAAQRLKRFHPILRPLVYSWLPEIANVRKHDAVARCVVKPVVEGRLRDGSRPVDLLQMLWDGAVGEDKSPDFLAYTALAVSFAAIRTSSSVPTHLLYDLCARPEYIQPLREEIEQMLDEEGSFTKTGFNKLVNLDSFIKESNRFSPLVFMTFGRVIHRDLTLQDGTIVPAGTIIGIPSHAISHDPEFYPSPSTFDGFRFVPDTTASHQQGPPSFVTTNASNLSWGYGKHACSGRFFASNEIKIIIAYFLLNYDFKFAKDRKDRPKNFSYELQNMPDPTVEIMIKRRPGARKLWK